MFYNGLWLMVSELVILHQFYEWFWNSWNWTLICNPLSTDQFFSIVENTSIGGIVTNTCCNLHFLYTRQLSPSNFCQNCRCSFFLLTLEDLGKGLFVWGDPCAIVGFWTQPDSEMKENKICPLTAVWMNILSFCMIQTVTIFGQKVKTSCVLTFDLT